MDVCGGADGEDCVGGAVGWGAEDAGRAGEGCDFVVVGCGDGVGEQGGEDGEECVESHCW